MEKKYLKKLMSSEGAIVRYCLLLSVLLFALGLLMAWAGI